MKILKFKIKKFFVFIKIVKISKIFTETKQIRNFNVKEISDKCINAIRLNKFECIKSCSFNLKRANLINVCIKFILKISLSC